MVYLIYRFFRVITFSINYLVIAENLTINKIKKGKLLFFIFNTIFFFIFISYNKKVLLPLTALLLLAGLIFTNVKNFKYAFLISILADIVFIVSEIIVTVGVSDILNTPIHNIQENSLENNTITFTFMIVSFIISKLVGMILNRIYKKSFTVDKESTVNSTIIFYSVFVLINICISIGIFSKFIDHLNKKFLIANGLTLICGIFIVLLLLYSNNKTLESRLQQEYKDRELQQLKEYVDTVEKLSDDLRKFKHDYNNIFNAMSTYIECDDIKGLKTFYKENLLPESEKIIANDVTPYLLKNMKINSLKGLISSKVNIAHFNDIKISIEIVDEINSISIMEIDICRIIGILFDNAIEAASLCDDRVIKFSVIKTEEFTLFKISNTCEGDIPPVYRLKEKGFSTKGNGRGIGLATVEDIVNKKYTNLSLGTKVDEGIFTQELIIIN